VKANAKSNRKRTWVRSLSGTWEKVAGRVRTEPLPARTTGPYRWTTGPAATRRRRATGPSANPSGSCRSRLSCGAMPGQMVERAGEAPPVPGARLVPNPIRQGACLGCGPGSCPRRAGNRRLPAVTKVTRRARIVLAAWHGIKDTVRNAVPRAEPAGRHLLSRSVRCDRIRPAKVPCGPQLRRMRHVNRGNLDQGRVTR
jgi:hypothetical protein